MTAVAPDLTVKVLGFRQFLVSNAGLQSVTAPVVWSPGVNRAKCLRGTLWPGAQHVQEHDAPAVDCTCGFYGWHTISAPYAGGRCVAAIAAWGRVEVHHAGFRAEFAEILAIAFEPRFRDAARRQVETLAATYRVPVVHLAELDAVARRAAKPIPTQLRPARPPESSQPVMLPQYGTWTVKRARPPRRLRLVGWANILAGVWQLIDGAFGEGGLVALAIGAFAVAVGRSWLRSLR